MPARQRYPRFSDANLRGVFHGAYDDAMAASYLNEVAMRVDSDSAFEQYGWLGTAPVMREWKGGRHLQQPNAFEWAIYNRKFESSISLAIDDIRRDKTGQFDIYASSLGQRAAENPVLLLSDLLIAAETSVCFDGQYFFDTDHVEGKSGINDNDISVTLSSLPVTSHGGSASTPSDEEMEKVILRMIRQLFSFKDDQGQPVNQSARQFAIVAPISLMDTVLAATQNKTMTSGRQNTLTTATNFKITPYFDPRLTWTTKLALFRTDHAVKPFIHQVEVDNELSSITDPDSEHVFKHDEYLFGVKRSEALGYGDYKKAVLATMA
jgi:phage major head subunit gpT-like protein